MGPVRQNPIQNGRKRQKGASWSSECLQINLILQHDLYSEDQHTPLLYWRSCYKWTQI